VAPCFKCSRTDHWARNCPENEVQSNLIDLEEESLDTDFTYKPKDPIRDLKACINAMTAKEKGQLADKMGVGEDFPMA
jgi:Zinc knuckle